MNSKKTLTSFQLSPIALVILATFGSAQAEEMSEVQQLITPESSVSLGIGTINSASKAKRFGQYTGMNNNNGSYLLLDFDKVNRDDATGTWSVIKGRNLGLDTRELGFLQQKQGDSKFVLEYNEIVRNDPYVIHTGLTGAGTTNPALNLIANPLPDIAGTWGGTGAGTANQFTVSNGVAGTDLELKVKRSAIGIGMEKWLSPEWMIEASFRNEDKKGARMFGRAGLASDQIGIGIGTLPLSNGNWALLLTPEPINSSIQQFDFKANYNKDSLALTGGYAASFYVNNLGSLTPNVPATLNRGPLTAGGTPAGALSIQQLASSSIALAPDNQAHQLYLTGNWAYSSATQTNFMLDYTHATQNENFVNMGLAPAATAPASLGGVVNTTFAQIGVTSRVTKDFSINSSLRYEKRDDKTPINIYNTGFGGGGLDNTTNWPSASQTRTSAKLDGTYRMTKGYSALLGVDWENKKVPLPPSNTAIFPNQVFMRPTLNEYGLHTELRKAMFEEVSAAIGAEYKQRRGTGDWVTSSTIGGAGSVVVPGTINRVLPDMYMDRNRSKLKGSLDWSVNNDLSMQAVLEHARDDYKRDGLLAIQSDANAGILASPVLTSAPIPGARIITTDSLSLDGSYAVTKKWQLSGYWTRSLSRWNVNKVNLFDDTHQTSDTVGLTIKGKVSSSLDVGLDLISSQDLTTFNNTITTAAGTGNLVGFNGTTDPGGNYLPNINYASEKVNMYGKYALEKNADILLNLTYQHFLTNDWQWGYKGIPFIYSDNTTVSQPQSQSLWFFGGRYILKL